MTFLTPRVAPLPSPGALTGREYQEAFKLIHTTTTPQDHADAVQGYLDYLRAAEPLVYVKKIDNQILGLPGPNTEYFSFIQYAIISDQLPLPL